MSIRLALASEQGWFEPTKAYYHVENSLVIFRTIQQTLRTYFDNSNYQGEHNCSRNQEIVEKFRTDKAEKTVRR